jgi:hypothetical chaperone protein
LSPERRTNLDRQQDVLAVTGTRLGGMECDKNLIVKSIAPTMGLGLEMFNGLPVPPTYFSDMCAVDNIPKLNHFFSDDYGLDIAQSEITLPLSYIEQGYEVPISLNDLERSMQSWLRRVKKLITECLDKSAEPPELLFVTGGMSLSPIVKQALQNTMLSHLPVIEGDAFNSVCEGLAIQAYKLSKS